MDDVRPYLVKEFALRAALEHSGYDLTAVCQKHDLLNSQFEAQQKMQFEAQQQKMQSFESNAYDTNNNNYSGPVPVARVRG